MDERKTSIDYINMIFKILIFILVLIALADVFIFSNNNATTSAEDLKTSSASDTARWSECETPVKLDLGVGMNHDYSTYRGMEEFLGLLATITDENVENETINDIINNIQAVMAESDSKTTETEPEKWWTEQDLEEMACVIYCEAGGDGCSDRARIAVGNVVLNRMRHPQFPDNIHNVLTAYQQYGRFYWTGVVWPERASKPEEANAVARAYKIAERVLNGETVVPGDTIWQAEFYQGTELVELIDGIYFCR